MIMFSKSISKAVIENILNQNNDFEFLDEVIGEAVNVASKNIPWFINYLRDNNIDNFKINSLKEYDKKIPFFDIKDVFIEGIENFQINNCKDYVNFKRCDGEILCEYYVDEGTKKGKSLNIPLTRAEIWAISFSLAFKLRDLGVDDSILINQKKNKSLAFSLFEKIVLKAFDILGLNYTFLSKEDDIELFYDKFDYVFDPCEFLRVNKKIDLDRFKVVLTTQIYEDKDYFYLGGYPGSSGLFPNVGLNSIIPIFSRLVDLEGNSEILYSGEVSNRGYLTVDRFFALYEVPSSFALLIEALMKSKNLIGFENDTFLIKDLLNLYCFDCCFESFSEQFFMVLRELNFDLEVILTKDVFREIFFRAIEYYFRKSIRVGLPKTFIPHLKFPGFVSMDFNGKISKQVPYLIDNEFLPSKNLPLKYKLEDFNFLNANIIGKTFLDGRYYLPYLRKPLVKKKVFDFLRGKNLFDKGKDGYLYGVSIISPKEFNDLIKSAKVFSELDNLEEVSLEDIFEILNYLYLELRNDLVKLEKGKNCMLSLFIEKTKIPISEVKSMIDRIYNDIVKDDFLGLKKIIYSAVVDSNCDFDNFTENMFEIALDNLSKFEVMSPSFLVTPGNINPYDSFYLFSQVLFVKLAQKRNNSFSLIVRNSESDLSFKFLIFKYFKFVNEFDKDNKKGFLSMIQSAYWDPKYDREYLEVGIKNAVAGVYYGTSKTYVRDRLKAVLSKAFETSSFDLEQIMEVSSLVEDFGDFKNILENNEIDLDNGLVDFVNTEISKHVLYPETLNAVILDSKVEDFDLFIESLVLQIIKLRSSDCTTPDKIWVKRDVYEDFIKKIREVASNLCLGDLSDINSNFSLYDEDILKKIFDMNSKFDSIEVVEPTFLDNHNFDVKSQISHKDNYTGLILHTLESKSLVNEHSKKNMFLNWLSKSESLPFLHIVVYDELEDLYLSLENVLEVYKNNSGYSRFLYISCVGDRVFDIEKEVNSRNFTDLFKKNESVFTQFFPYYPHQGSFFINEFLKKK